MPEDNGRKAAKAVALLLVLTWCVTTVTLTIESIASVSPPFYGVFTAVTFALVGKLWDLEVQAYLPGGGKS